MQQRARAGFFLGIIALGLGCGRTEVGVEAPFTVEPVAGSATGAIGGVGGGAPAFGGNPGPSMGGSGGSGAGGTATVPRTDFSFALWPMPNAVSSGLPNPASYDTSMPGAVLDNVTGLMWQAEPLSMGLPWMETKVGCEMLVLGGYEDWRMPSRIELVSLLSFEAGSMTDSSAFPFQASPDLLHWSASPFAEDPSMRVWLVSGFSTQTGYATTVGGELPARCVRSTRLPPPPPHYDVQGPVVHDTWTNLVWQRTPPASYLSLGESKAYCHGLSLGGYEDWYLPSLKELLTLVDEKRAVPALDANVFPGSDELVNGWFWTSTLYPPEMAMPYVAPGLSFSEGSTMGQYETSLLLPRCVREG